MLTFPVTVFAGLCAALLQVVVWRSLRPKTTIGDEGEYLAVDDRSKHWIRVPLQGWIIHTLNAFAPSPDTLMPRIAMSVISIVTVVIATGAVEMSFGTFAAMVTSIFLLCSLERAILALHLWPDISLGLVILVFALLLANLTPSNAPWLAIVALFGFALRVEALVLCALACVAPALLLGPPVALPALWLTALGLFVFCLRSRILFHSWLPDTTAFFNINVARTERSLPADATTLDVMVATQNQSPDERAKSRTNASMAYYLMGRIRTILGPETFVTQNILRHKKQVYEGKPWLNDSGFRLAILRYGFVIMVAGTLPVIGFAPVSMTILLGLMLTIYCALNSRSRYRMAILPLLSLIAGAGWQGWLAGGGTGTQYTLGVISLLLFGLMLASAPVRAER